MIRWIGAVLVAGGGFWLGLGRARWHQSRVRVLQALIFALGQMERELREASPPMAELLAVAAKCAGPLEGCFAACLTGLSALEERPFAQLWEEAFRSAGLPLNGEELDQLAALGQVLGRYDQESQRNALQGTADLLRRDLTEAREEERRLGRLDCVLGGAAGLLAVILLL